MSRGTFTKELRDMVEGKSSVPDEVTTGRTLRYNKEVYADYYANPLLKLRYDCLYRARRMRNLLFSHGVDPRAPGFQAFEYGFGAGHLLDIVKDAGEVVGVEFSPSAVARARAKAHRPGWKMMEWADGKKIPLDSGRFDLVTASHVLEHLENDGLVLDEWIRLVRPGGHLLIILPANEVLFEGSKHLRTYRPDSFCARLRRRGLREVVVDEHQYFDRPFKHRRLVLAARRSFVVKMLVDIPKTLMFLPLQLVSWRALAGLDGLLAQLGARSSSIAYLFRKPGL